MAENQARGRILRTWKDVATYLQCSVRTCRRWEEKHSLPIHRIGTTLRSGIFAYEYELDAWLGARGEVGGREDGTARGRRTTVALLPFIGLAIVGLAFLGFIFLLVGRRQDQPTDFRFENNNLVIISGRGKDLGRFDARLDNLSTDEYHRHFQIKRQGLQGPDLPYLIIKDLDRDGWNEVLFSTQTLNEIGEGDLYCVDHLGNKKWQYKTGREMAFGDKLYSDDYRIRGIDCFDLNGDRELEVLVIAAQRPEWPCQITVLDCRGKVTGEYWNGGYVADYAFVDLNEDNRIDIVLTGIYNEKKTGFLAVFDSAAISGGSPQMDAEYISKEVGAGSDICYLLIPRTDADLARFPAETLEEVLVLKNKRLQAMTSYSGIFYEFGSDLRLLDIKGSHKMEQLHSQLLREGRISSTFGSAYLNELKNGVKYWSGRDWIREPTLHNKWPTSMRGQ